LEQNLDQRKQCGHGELERWRTGGAEAGQTSTPSNACTDQCERFDQELAQQECEDPPKPKGTDRSALGLIIVFALLIQATIYSPQIVGALTNLTQPGERVFLGTVQKVAFTGGLGTATQVDTESHTLLLRGAASLTPGARLERRKGWWAMQACDMQTSACWDLINP
jgi:hypothetical protein